MMRGQTPLAIGCSQNAINCFPKAVQPLSSIYVIKEADCKINCETRRLILKKQEELTAKVGFQSHTTFTLHTCIRFHKMHVRMEGPAFTFLLTELVMKAFGILNRVFIVRVIGRV
jgi:hypothetical protein